MTTTPKPIGPQKDIKLMQAIRSNCWLRKTIAWHQYVQDGVRPAARMLSIDPGHFVRLRDGNANASDELLSRLGLKRVTKIVPIKEDSNEHSAEIN